MGHIYYFSILNNYDSNIELQAIPHNHNILFQTA